MGLFKKKKEQSRGSLPHGWESKKLPNNFYDDEKARIYFQSPSPSRLPPDREISGILGVPRFKTKEEMKEDSTNGTSIRKLGFDMDLTIEQILTLPKGIKFDLENPAVFNDLKLKIDQKLNPQKYLEIRKKSLRSNKTVRKGFPDSVKEQVLIAQNHRCAKCRQFLTTVDFDHADGDRYNNDISNCQALCPNCHTYKSRHNIVGHFVSVEDRPDYWVVKSKWHDVPDRKVSKKS